jgi:5'-3' exonuclease
MGVRKLFKFLSDHKIIKEYSTLTRYVNIKRKSQKSDSIIVAIDFWLYAYKFTYSYGNMVIGFWNQIIRLLSHKILPVYIYDGQPPDEKSSVLQGRQRKRNNMEARLKDVFLDDSSDEKMRLEKSIIYIKRTDIENVKQFFDILSIPYLDAMGEADFLCAKLYKEGLISACLSDDMDMLALGCEKTIKFLDGKVLEFDLEHILNNLDLTYEQFVEMCILFGCDYVKPNFRLLHTDSYELIKKYKTIDSILDNANHEVFNRDNEKCSHFIEGYNNAKHILMTSYENEVIPEDFRPTITEELDPFIVLKYLKIYGQVDFVSDNMQQIIDSIEYVNNFISIGVFS